MWYLVGLVYRVVPKGGLEPPQPLGYTALNRTRLRIPPLRQIFLACENNITFKLNCQEF